MPSEPTSRTDSAASRLTAGVCVIHLIRNSFRLTSRTHVDALKRDLKAIYTAPTPEAAGAALDVLEDNWGAKYPAMIRLWRNAWTEFVPFLDYGARRRIGVSVSPE